MPLVSPRFWDLCSRSYPVVKRFRLLQPYLGHLCCIPFVCMTREVQSAYNLNRVYLSCFPLLLKPCSVSETINCNESNYLNHPKHPRFQEKWLIIVFQAFKHPRLKLLFQYPNTYTYQSSNGGCQTSAFDSLCGATAKITKHLPAQPQAFSNIY